MATEINPELLLILKASCWSPPMIVKPSKSPLSPLSLSVTSTTPITEPAAMFSGIEKTIGALTKLGGLSLISNTVTITVAVDERRVPLASMLLAETVRAY